MVDFKNALRLFFVLLAYGLAGYLDHDDEQRLAQGLVQSTTADRLPKCPLQGTEEDPDVSGPVGKRSFVAAVAEVASASSNPGELDTAQSSFDLICPPNGL